jgi:glucose-1-phosphate cytidylyltransferase
MKAVILAGGLGTRLSEETVSKPKPLVEIGGYPIIWHLMKSFYHQSVTEFIICCGYKGYMLKNFFKDYAVMNADLKINGEDNSYQIVNNNTEDWKVHLVDTGSSTMTGGRLLRLKELLSNEKEFFFTYGDGLSDVNLKELYSFHKNHGKYATITASYPQARFGALDIQENNIVRSFKEKPQGDGAYINAGFFVLKNEVMDYIDDDKTIWEKEPLESLAKDQQLYSYKHNSFWYPMDTIRDRQYLEDLWNSSNAPWKNW